MVRRRWRAYRVRVRRAFEAASAEERTPHEVAGSFAVGTFVTTLPTLGAGLLVLAGVAYRYRNASVIALFAPVIILNPVVKWGVYGASFWLGNRLLGPVPGVTFDGVSFAVGTDIGRRLLLGNVILALVLSGLGYAALHRFVREYRRLELEAGELVVQKIAK